MEPVCVNGEPDRLLYIREYEVVDQNDELVLGTEHTVVTSPNKKTMSKE